MLDLYTYELMLEKYSNVGSWAVWERPTFSPKSNTDNMDWDKLPDVLQILNTGYIFVGLNWSNANWEENGIWTIPWANFHSGYSYQTDYKLRYALMDTKYWGSYITDLIKLHVEVESGKVSSYLKMNPAVVKENIESFEEEISYLGDKPVLVALGGEVYKYLKQYLGDKYKIICIKHYAYTISKENYRKEVLDSLDAVQR